MSDSVRLPRLLPPPGGEARLRAALHRYATTRSMRSRRRFAMAFSAAAVAVLVMVSNVTWRSGTSMDARLRAAFATPAAHIVVRDGAALALPSANPRVRIFLIATLPTGSDLPASRDDQG